MTMNTSVEKKSLGKMSKKGMKRQEKKGIKVVYISNPMKVTASASEFRALVQQLTGQYAPTTPFHGPVTEEEVKTVGSEVGEEEEEGCCDEWMMMLDNSFTGLLASDCSFLTAWPVS